MKTRAVWFTGERQAELLEDEVAEAGDDEVTVKAIVSGISSGTEMKAYRGHMSDVTPIDEGSYIAQGKYPFPLKYGYSSVGEVVAAGRNTDYKVGDHVFAAIPHQELFTLNAGYPLLHPVDKAHPLEMYTLEALLSVAVNTFHDVPVSLGENVAIFGQGAVGLFATQLAKRTAAKVIAVDPIAKRRELALELGADVAVDPADAVEAIRDSTDGRGADVTIEVSGAPQALQSAFDSTALEGTVAVPSFYGDRPVSLVLSPAFHVGRLRVVSSQVNNLPSRLTPRWDYARRGSYITSLLPSMNTDKIITHRIPFDEAARAYELLDTAGDGIVSAVLTYPNTDR